jgi:alpha-beta hydrolase superfamily lysophospholipase
LPGSSGTRRLLLDHRGHGASEGPTGLEEHRLDQYVADVIEVLGAAGDRLLG